MKLLPVAKDLFFQWIDSVARTAAQWRGSLKPLRTVTLVEEEGGKFIVKANDENTASPLREQRIEIGKGPTIDAIPDDVQTAIAGSQVEIVLQPSRFLFRRIELPGRAVEFLEGVVRAQIDGLTPWSAAEAAFGCGKPTEAGPDRILVTVAATARSKILPYVNAIAVSGARSVRVVTLSEGDADADAIPVWNEAAGEIVEVGRIRPALVAVLAGSGIAAVLAFSASMILGPVFDAKQEAVMRRIIDARAAIGATRDAESGSAAAAQHGLAVRKNDRPPNVIVLEKLSQVLPDHTYVTELRIEDDKLRVSGITQDAPSLIGLLERSGQFAQATFFAPTTRSPSENGERFNIEAHIQPAAPRS